MTCEYTNAETGSPPPHGLLLSAAKSRSLESAFGNLQETTRSPLKRHLHRGLASSVWLGHRVLLVHLNPSTNNSRVWIQPYLSRAAGCQGPWQQHGECSISPLYSCTHPRVGQYGGYLVLRDRNTVESVASLVFSTFKGLLLPYQRSPMTMFMCLLDTYILGTRC